MTKQQKINQLETKIREIQNSLTLWNQDIQKYSLTLTELTNQLNEIKKQSNKK